MHHSPVKFMSLKCGTPVESIREATVPQLQCASSLP